MSRERLPCGCCEADTPRAPEPIDNRPGLTSVRYRSGTFATYRHALLAAVAHRPELAALGVRDSDDYAVNVLEQWAAVADVVSFYNERSFNGALLRTTEALSDVVRLARLVGYRLTPATSAVAWLAFTLDAGRALTIPAGTPVQSAPTEGDERPQTFETQADLAADARLNALPAHAAPSSTPALVAGRPYAVAGRADGPEVLRRVAPGDRLVVAGSAGVEWLEVATLDVERDRVEVRFTAPIATTWPAATPVFKAGRSLRLFGWNAPESTMTPAAAASAPGGIRWTLSTTAFDTAAGHLVLDGDATDLAPGTRLVVLGGTTSTVVTVVAATATTDELGGLSGPATRVDVTPDVPAFTDRRLVTVVEAVGAAVPLWGGAYSAAITDAVWVPAWPAGEPGVYEVGRGIEGGAWRRGAELRLDDIPEDRVVVLEDDSHPPVDAVVSGPVTYVPVDAGFGHLRVPIRVDGTPVVDPMRTRLLGNVVQAAHVSTVREDVGAGDASVAYPRFALRRPGLTRMPAGTAEGSVSTLHVRVDGVLWREVPTLYQQPSTAAVYVTDTDAHGRTVVQFGAARPPTGRPITAVYGVGGGREGRVGSGALSRVTPPVPGLTSARNPAPAVGGADAEVLADARRNAPRSVQTFGRAVSEGDVAAIVRRTGEAAKAHATVVWDGFDRVVHVTVVGQDAAPFDATGLSRLGNVLRAAAAPHRRFLLANAVVVPIGAAARLLVEPDRDVESVLSAARDAAAAEWSFERTELGAPVHLSDLYRVLQGVPGVRAVLVTRLGFDRPGGWTDAAWSAFLSDHRPERDPGGAVAAVQPRLLALPGRLGPPPARALLPAELLSAASPAAIELTAETAP